MNDDLATIESQAAPTYDLLVDYLAGESRNESEVYERLRSRVLLIARSRLRPWLRQRESSEDIAQEALVGLWDSIEKATFDHPGKLAAYLSVVVQHAICNRARHHKVEVRNPAYMKPIERSRPHMSTTEFRTELEAQDKNPLSQLLVTENEEATHAALAECLDELPEHYREVIIHRVLCNMRNKDAARAMGREPDSAFSMLSSRARARMANLMAARGFGVPGAD